MFTSRRTLEVKPHQLRHLALQTAACVMFICRQRGTAEGADADPISKAARVYLQPDAYDWYYGLWSQVSMVFGYVSLILENPDIYEADQLGPNDRRFLANALEVYQDWKVEYIEARNSQPGHHLGLPFEHEDVTIWNERLLA